MVNMAAQGPTLMFVNYDDPLHPAKSYCTPIRQHVMRQAMVQRRLGNTETPRQARSSLSNKAQPRKILEQQLRDHTSRPGAGLSISTTADSRQGDLAIGETLMRLPTTVAAPEKAREVTEAQQSNGAKQRVLQKSRVQRRDQYNPTEPEVQNKPLPLDLSYQRHLTPARPPPGYSARHAADIGEWYFLGPTNGCFASCGSAAHHLSTNLWRMMVQDSSLFACLGALAFRKRALVLERREDERYIEHKGMIMRNIRRLLTPATTTTTTERRLERVVRSQAVMSMATLAYLQICDEEFDAAEAHLRGLLHVVSQQSLSELEWFVLAWTNVRLALFVQMEPILPFFVAEGFRTSNSVDERMKQRPRSNLEVLPEVESVDRGQIFDLLYKLHWLSQKELHLDTRSQPPFGMIYELDHNLRTLDAAVHNSREDSPQSKAFELIIVSGQLHAWTATRHWTPQRLEAYRCVLRRAVDLLPAAYEPLQNWSKHTDLSVLLWILNTITTVNLDFHIVSHPCLRMLLLHVIQAMSITSFEGYCDVLKSWPWSEDWHPVRCELVWADVARSMDEITSGFILSAEAVELQEQELSAEAVDLQDCLSKASGTDNMFFLGGLEFYKIL